MTSLVLHPIVEKQLDALVNKPPHAVCLSGDRGSGLSTIAHQFAERIVKNTNTITTISPEKGLISIERVRGLYADTRSIQHDHRCIIIDDADTMSPDAQNALLKLLEEPTNNTHFILTTHAASRLLATIRSRVQEINMQPITAAQSQELLAPYGLDAAKQAQILFLASGLPAELVRLATDEEYFAKQSGLVGDARAFLQSDTYSKLVVIKKYTDRTSALELLEMCAKLLSFTLLKQKNVATSDTMFTLDEVMGRIEANGHVRTQLMYLASR